MIDEEDILNKHLQDVFGFSKETKGKIISAMKDYAQMKVNELNKFDVIKSLPADWEFLIKDLMLFIEKNGDVCNGFRSRETILEMKKKIEAGNVLY